MSNEKEIREQFKSSKNMFLSCLDSNLKKDVEHILIMNVFEVMLVL